jgi:3',5'-cyclic-AMP phosphodiesterase
MKTISCELWISEEFFPEINFSFAGIKPHRSQSGTETSRINNYKKQPTNMKNKPNKIREVRRLEAEADHIEHDHQQERDGIDRRGFLKCMAWAGTGMLWTVTGGVLGSKILSPTIARAAETSLMGDFSFVQISDSHIGFNKPANPNVVGTLKRAIAKINALSTTPEFILHTGDLSHLSEPEEFDTLDQLLKTTKTGKVFYVPGEHDVISDGGKEYRNRYGKGTKGDGWFSFDQHGVHFIGLVNVMNIAEGSLGTLGADQLAWLKDDVSGLGASTPIVVFAHVPLWSIYPQWGWGTRDAEQALGYLKRFGSVTVLNGHIHQVFKKVEGNVTFHTAVSTAFPQPQPGTAPKPGPMKVAPEILPSVLGITEVNYVESNHSLAIVDDKLG